MRTVLLLLSLLLPCLLVGCGVVDLPDTVGAPAPSPTMAGPSTTDPAPIERPTTWSTPAWSASEGCSAAGATVHEGEQPPYSGTGSAMDRVHLIDNPSAQDPTWEELVSFLLADGTDRKDYVSGRYVCADFAEELHNNAEAAGVRAAYVAIEFHDESTGHALNAFCTVDRGLVFVDCTHSSDFDASPGEGRELYGIPTGWDKVAYVEIGSVYGLVSLEEAVCPAYECYEDHNALADSFVKELEEYNAEVDAYNDWVEGRVFIEGSDEHRQATEWQARLDSRAKELDTLGDSLGAFWQPMGTVMEIDVYW